MFPFVRRSSRAGSRRTAGRALVAAVAVTALAGSVAACSSGGRSEASQGEIRTSPIAAQLANLPARVEDAKIVVGAPDAPRTAQVLVDPHCGYCRIFEGTGGEALLTAALDGKVKVEYLLASFLDQGGSGSLKAVNALRAAVDRGRFAEYHAAVFASQPQGAFTDERLLEIADRIPGLRSPAFDKAVTGHAYEDWARRAERAFEATGAEGTPLVLLDGKPLGKDDRSMFDAGAFKKTLAAAGIG
ncbi:thioredoxin domain-containing protein [Streptomyces sp. NPDC089919]|uniref:thioredoxin domain-containing protein n=1 Tax=Streptomyces sp. NPDC089919 TaxID=3155188 RepID=UPI00341BA5AC